MPFSQALMLALYTSRSLPRALLSRAHALHSTQSLRTPIPTVDTFCRSEGASDD